MLLYYVGIDTYEARFDMPADETIRQKSVIGKKLRETRNHRSTSSTDRLMVTRIIL